MTNLHEIIPIINNDGQQAVSLRNLYDFLEVKRDFTTWAKKMFEYGFVEGADYAEISLPQKGEQTRGGQNRRDWACTLDMGKEISMIQRTPKGKQARQYFIAVEKQASIELSDDELIAKALIKANETLEASKRELETIRPKAQAWETLVSATGDYSVDEAAKILSRDWNITIGRNRLFDFMHQIKWTYRAGRRKSWHAYQEQVDNGRLRLRMNPVFQNRITGELETPAPTIRVTAKGVEALREKLQEKVKA
ncbi:phage antirepressor KilAC domain-containing protein [Auritidibacter ignavus]|uniref:Phage antirepressor KilAC domain-containing protein n=1 Tax=Auritidibacter ignavus TaxID=678932 RepID=A0AAJ6AL87_9MICC|nr:phage antirepressor KilAC domain-containing protein [Auritidibacter ignavus]WGH92125.1 phage antirepressor KilAC domain-containing protein [Auritidibacter ignavus]